MNRHLIARLQLFVGMCYCWLPLVAAERPMTGQAVPEFAAVDSAVNESMDLIEAQAASIAIARDGEIIYARGYGWADADQTQPVSTGTTFRIASVTKPITAAIIKHLVREGKVALDQPVFEYLQIEPYNGESGDQRLSQVTIQHLLDHRGGWDRRIGYDPTYRFDHIASELGQEHVDTTDVVRFMLAQPLDHAPGEQYAYSNFGYLTLGCVIEKATGQPYEAVLQSLICQPLEIVDLRPSCTEPGERDPNEVHYPRESGLDIRMRDSYGGLTASPTSLCRFMRHYWISGDLRDNGTAKKHHHFGAHPRSTIALAEQREDGIDFAVLFNARRGGDNDDSSVMRKAVNAAIDQVVATQDSQAGLSENSAAAGE